jgi:selenocysteine lyase/cysteine desulfurase
MAKASLDERIPQLRTDTPGCAEVAHFNHAGDSLSPNVVLDAVVDHLHLEARIGGYEAADEAEARLEAVYDSIATLINAQRDEIAIVENATRGWDMAFYAIPLKPGDRILTSVSEYGSNAIAFLQAAQQTGATVEVIPNDDSGQVSVAALAEMLDRRVKIVAISHMPTNGGLVQPAAAIGKVLAGAGEAKPVYILDACQTTGQMPLDVREIGCDVLSATSRKYLRGPRGVGFLYVREGLIEKLTPPFLDNHAATWVAADRIEIRRDARRFENWESYVAGKLGLGAAVDLALQLGLDQIWSRIERQAAALRHRLGDIPGVTVRDLGAVKGGIVTFDVDGIAPKEIVHMLRAKHINTSASSVFSTRYDMERRGLSELVRASVSYLTTDDEIDLFVYALASAIAVGIRDTGA